MYTDGHWGQFTPYRGSAAQCSQEIDRQTDQDTHRRTDRQTRHTPTDRQTRHTPTDRQTDKAHTDRQTDRTHTDSVIISYTVPQDDTSRRRQTSGVTYGGGDKRLKQQYLYLEYT